MTYRLILSVMIFGGAIVAGADEKSTDAKGYPCIYEAQYLPEARVVLDGALDEPEWKKSVALTRFAFPWEKRPAPETVFQAFMSEDFFYFAFRVQDSDVVIDNSSTDKLAVTKGDRVEMFFARDAALSRYYCFEIDPLARILDYSAQYYRKFDYEWTFPGLRAKAVLTKDGYLVEGEIPLKTLDELLGASLLNGDILRAGIYRAEFSQGTGKIDEHWISWIDPKTEKEDFHIAATFGGLRRSKANP